MNNFLSISLREIYYDVSQWLDKHIMDLICGWITAALCYFFEIRGAIHIMLIIIAADLLSGMAASILIRKETFSMKKFSLAGGRAVVFVALVMMLFALDKETHQDITASYFIATYIISGAYLWSFVKNAGEIFGGGKFKLLQGLLTKQVQEKTGIDISESEVEHGRI